ncbi:MAG: T9SS type A sorting domain-containing protein [Bacteroidota bacterium]|nr:T9SS type A sorting domain-containing protein [Bacteroidota bacterium]
MKKGLLLTLSVVGGLGLFAQAPKVAGAKKADLTNSKASAADAGQFNFYASASASQRNGNPAPTPATTGTYFTSSYNAFTLLVSSSHCLTANQDLNAVMFTHRISQDWPADPNVNSGYVEYSWTNNYGTSWDSSYFADQTNLGNKRFRYPSGAIINPAGNTNIANAWNVASGPYTDGATSSPWKGYYNNYQQMMNGATSNTGVYTTGQPGVFPNDFPRISITSYEDSSAWVSGGLYADAGAATAAAQGYRGATLMKAKMDNTGLITWSFDSIHPTFHQDGAGINDCFTQALTGFNADGSIGYCVFFGVDAAQTTSTMRSFLPIVYKTTNSGGSWTLQPMNDFTTIAAIANRLIPASDGQLKPWFNQSEGADVVVDANDQLHIICVVGSGSSNHDDSLGYTWNLTGQNGTTAMNYMYDVHTTTSGWDAWLIDSLMCGPSTTSSIFFDGTNSNTIYATDARLQVSHTTDRTKLFYTWVDSDPTALSGENALPDLFGKGVDINNGMATARKQFTFSQDFYFHYSSNVALVSGSTYKIAATNSIDRNGSHDVATTFDHYFFNGATFDSNEFNTWIGISNPNAEVVSFNAYPNPATDAVNVSLNMVNNGKVSITLLNSIGQQVLVENRELASGSNTILLNTSALPSGIYLVVVTTPSGNVTSKIVIE